MEQLINILNLGPDFMPIHMTLIWPKKTKTKQTVLHAYIHDFVYLTRHSNDHIGYIHDEVAAFSLWSNEDAAFSL